MQLLGSISEKITLSNGETLILCEAKESDMPDIKSLYYRVYGGKYTLAEVTDSDKMKWVINDPNYLWLLLKNHSKIVSSVIFVVDPVHKIGKTIAGVVIPDYRGYKILKLLLKTGLNYFLNIRNFADIIYGIVRTFAPVSFHNSLKDLGFVDIGIFPNVRKVQKYETHGLKSVFKEGVLSQRKATPNLIAPANQIYEITRKKLGLENAVVENDYLINNKLHTEFKEELFIEKSPEIEWEYYRHRDAGELLFDFFPFNYPQIKLFTRDHKTEVFIHFLEIDGYASITGIKTDQNNLIPILNKTSLYVEEIGIKYIEMLVSAYDIEKQKQCYSAHFLPCAYFPAASKEGSFRYDYLVFCRLFVPLTFEEMHFTEDSKPYAIAYHKINSKRILEDLEDD